MTASRWVARRSCTTRGLSTALCGSEWTLAVFAMRESDVTVVNSCRKENVENAGRLWRNRSFSPIRFIGQPSLSSRVNEKDDLGRYDGGLKGLETIL